MSVERMVAVLVAMVCVVMLVRLCLPASRRMRFDQTISRQWVLTSNAVRRLFRSRDVRNAERARQATAEAIERARRASRVASVVKEGNVYKPEAFQKPRKPH